MKTTGETFFQEIRKGVVYPVYLFEGELFFLEEAWKELIEIVEKYLGRGKVLKKRLSPKEVSESELSELLLTTSFGISKKVLWIHELKGFSRNLVKTLIRAIERPNPSIHLVISLAGDQKTINEVLEISRKSNVPHIVFPSPKIHQLPYWIRNRLKKLGKSISLDGARYIAELVGKDFYTLDKELEKLSLAVTEKTITVEDISTFIAGTRASSPFEIMDAALSGKPSLALLKLTELIESGEQPIALLGLLARHVRLLWQVKSAEEDLKDPNEVKSYLNLSDFMLSHLKRQCHTISEEQLRILHRKLYEADLKLKTSSMPPLYILSSIILSLS
ncbi:MAG: DNA polymerase III subunit delta [Syntrophobacterales bacterium]|nr:DNA polymerase III subunit delta [Syntrophobacterales bacterium]